MDAITSRKPLRPLLLAALLSNPICGFAVLSDAKADAASAAKTGAAKADDKKDAPKERGLFGKMLEKIGM